MRFALATLLLLPTLTSVSHAAESVWFDTDGVRLQLITDDRAQPDGRLQAVLRVDLKPGWKTYWMDPGDAGVPPQIDTGKSPNITGASIQFPAPERFDDGTTHWAGYDRSVDLPVTFTVADPLRFTAIDANVLLGVCKDVCIPVQTILSVTPDPQANTNPADSTIAAAFSNLPENPSGQFGVASFRLAGDAIIASVSAPAYGGKRDLFVVAPSGWLLAAPNLDKATGAYSIRIAGRPAAGELPKSLQYTLVAGDRSVTGSADLR